MVRWQKILFKQGWAAPTWPVEHGGTGWSHTKTHILRPKWDFTGHQNPFRLDENGGPVIMAYGSEEQKQRFLPDIWRVTSGGARDTRSLTGSDLASLKTAAVREGDEYVVNGAKPGIRSVSMQTGFLPGPDRQHRKKQEGISFLLIDMKTPGITIKPIVLLDGFRGK